MTNQTRVNIIFVIKLSVIKLEKNAAIKRWFYNLISVQKFTLGSLMMLKTANLSNTTKARAIDSLYKGKHNYVSMVNKRTWRTVIAN